MESQVCVWHQCDVASHAVAVFKSLVSGLTLNIAAQYHEAPGVGSSS